MESIIGTVYFTAVVDFARIRTKLYVLRSRMVKEEPRARLMIPPHLPHFFDAYVLHTSTDLLRSDDGLEVVEEDGKKDSSICYYP